MSNWAVHHADIVASKLTHGRQGCSVKLLLYKTKKEIGLGLENKKLVSEMLDKLKENQGKYLAGVNYSRMLMVMGVEEADVDKKIHRGDIFIASKFYYLEKEKWAHLTFEIHNCCALQGYLIKLMGSLLLIVRGFKEAIGIDTDFDLDIKVNIRSVDDSIWCSQKNIYA